MKKKKVIIIAGVILLTLAIPIFWFIENSRDRSLTIWTEDKEYEDIKEKIKFYEELDSNVKIKVREFKEEELADVLNKTAQKEWPDIAIINDIDLFYLQQNYSVKDLNNSIVSNNQKFFSEGVIERVKYDDKYMGIPLTVTAVAMYLNGNVIDKYNYDYRKIDTWSSLINIAKSMYQQSNGGIKLFLEKDINIIKEVIINQMLVDNGKFEEIKSFIDRFINELYNKNLIGKDEKGEYLCRISSLDILDEIRLANDLQWICAKVPAISKGGNRFVDLGGKNLVVLNSNDNVESIQDFCTYIIRENNITLKNIYEKNIFPASKVVYGIGKIDEELPGIKGESPMVILSNITQRTSPIKDMELKSKLYSAYGL